MFQVSPCTMTTRGFESLRPPKRIDLTLTQCEGFSILGTVSYTHLDVYKRQGMQIAFAFFLGILQGYAPATDLTVLRDRIAGILLGNIAVSYTHLDVYKRQVLGGGS